MKHTIYAGLFAGVAFCFASSAIAQNCTAPPSGLVSWWPAEGNANDLVDDNDGVQQNGATFAPGKVGQGFSLDGLDDFVLVDPSPNLNITGDVTVGYWAQRSVLGSAVLVSKGAGFLTIGRDVPSVYITAFTNDAFHGLFERASGSNANLLGPTVTDTNFHYYNYVRGGTEHSLYLDGAMVATISFFGFGSPGDTTGLPLTIGGQRHDSATSIGGFTNFFGGIIDELEIYNRALTTSEIQAIFNAGSAGKCTGPITTNVMAAPNPVAINTAIALSADVEDIASAGSTIDSANYTIDGGADVGMTAADSGFDEKMEAVTAVVPAFVDAGVHQLCVSGTDTAGETGAEDCTFLAVFDPSAGFVTGGGWIDSPAGACQFMTACATAVGKASFGFVSKCKKGAQTPTGITEFQFTTGDINFHSASYEWLVIANHRAQYKGVGTINGGGNYGFLLFAIDANRTPSTDVDLFRIKIWDKNNGDMIVYDNNLGGPDDADPTTQIGGGSIMIQTKGEK